jgi:predicted ATPase
LAVVKDQGALLFELRIVLSLARFRAAQDRRDEVGAILGSVYDKFTEGLETTDLCSARSMLDTLTP